MHTHTHTHGDRKEGGRFRLFGAKRSRWRGRWSSKIKTHGTIAETMLNNSLQKERAPLDLLVEADTRRRVAPMWPADDPQTEADSGGAHEPPTRAAAAPRRTHARKTV